MQTRSLTITVNLFTVFSAFPTTMKRVAVHTPHGRRMHANPPIHPGNALRTITSQKQDELIRNRVTWAVRTQLLPLIIPDQPDTMTHTAPMSHPNTNSSVPVAMAPKGNKLGVCITGQLSRLELATKIERLLKPARAHGWDSVDLVLVLDDSSDSFVNKDGTHITATCIQRCPTGSSP